MKVRYTRGTDHLFIAADDERSLVSWRQMPAGIGVGFDRRGELVRLAARPARTLFNPAVLEYEDRVVSAAYDSDGSWRSMDLTKALDRPAAWVVPVTRIDTCANLVMDLDDDGLIIRFRRVGPSRGFGLASRPAAAAFLKLAS